MRIAKTLIYILIVTAGSMPSVEASPYTEPTAWYSSSSQSREHLSAKSAIEFNETRKMGVGTVLSGATGLIGAHMHLYIGADFGLGLGYGGADNLKALNLYFRHLITNNTLSFYWTAGYARWWNGGGEKLTHSTPDYLYEKFLTASQKESGQFVKHIIYPGLGAQLYNFSGEMQGLSFYAEGLVMADIGEFRVQPALGLGAFYYF